MMTIRPAAERGETQIDWLDSKHSFSFGHYYDPAHMGFGPLRVINDDRVAPGGGFPPHPHSDMEIISYVLDGGLAHRDSTGAEGVVRPGDVQRMTAGTGVRHSEYNASKTAPVHFLQIWIEPDTKGIPPSYEEKHFSADSKRGKLRLIGLDGSAPLSIADAKNGRGGSWSRQGTILFVPASSGPIFKVAAAGGEGISGH